MSQLLGLRSSLALLFDRGNTAKNVLTVSRSTVANRYNKFRNIEEVAIDVPRLDYDPTTGALKGLFVEKSGTNLVAHSEAFNQGATWSNLGSRITVLSNDAVAPNNEETADKLTSNNTSEGRLDCSLSFTAGTTYTFTFFAEDINNGWCHILAYDGSANGVRVWFNLTNGTVGSETTFGSGYSFDRTIIKKVGNGFYRCEATITVPSSVTGVFGLGLSNGNGNIAQTVGQSINVWGAQIEVGARASSYIKTNSATATRSADAISIEGSAFTDFYNPNEGTFLMTIDKEIIPGTINEKGFQIDDGTDVNRIILDPVEAQLYVRTNDVVVANIEGTDLTVSGVYTFGVRLQKNNVALFMNGVKVGEDLSCDLPTVVDRMDIGHTRGLSHLNAHIKRLVYYPIALADQTIIDLTT